MSKRKIKSLHYTVYKEKLIEIYGKDFHFDGIFVPGSTDKKTGKIMTAVLDEIVHHLTFQKYKTEKSKNFLKFLSKYT